MSQGTRLVRDEAGLAELAHDAGYAAGWEALASLAGEAPAADGYLVEEAVEGRECTLEGYVHDGRVTVIGVTDSIFYPGTGSFERFEYPSSLPPARLAELGALAGAAAAGARLRRRLLQRRAPRARGRARRR